MAQLIGLSTGIFVVLLGLFFALARWRRRHGAADGVRQLVALDSDRILSVEYQIHTGSDDGGLREERWSVRSLADGRLLARTDVDGGLRVVARGRRHLVAVGGRPRVCVFDLSPAVVAGEAEVKASNPGLGELAPPDSLSPEVSGGGLSVLTAQGRRATLALLSALGDDGQPRWTTPLDRSLVRDACAAVVAGGGVVFALAARAPRPAELLCVDLRDGAVRWRTRT